jgi:hypothetical protein
MNILIFNRLLPANDFFYQQTPPKTLSDQLCFGHVEGKVMKEDMYRRDKGRREMLRQCMIRRCGLRICFDQPRNRKAAFAD